MANNSLTVDKRPKGESKRSVSKVLSSCRNSPRGQNVNVFCDGPHKSRKRDVFESASCWPPAVREVRARCWGEFGPVLHEHTPVNYSYTHTALCPLLGAVDGFGSETFKAKLSLALTWPGENRKKEMREKKMKVKNTKEEKRKLKEKSIEDVKLYTFTKTILPF